MDLNFQVNEYLPGIKEKLILFGEEVYRQGESGIAWTREHGLCCLESAAKSTVKAATVGAELVKDGAVAVAQCCKDIYE